MNSAKVYLRNVKKRYLQFERYHIPFLIIVSPLMILLSLERPVFYALCFVANVFLVQSWWPDAIAATSFNSVAWFLSTSFFLFCVTPALEYINEKLNSQIVIQIIVVFLCFSIAVALSLKIKVNCTVWLYIFPPTRLLDYVAGFFFGEIFKENRKRVCSVRLATVLELICAIVYFWLLSINITLPENMRFMAIYMPSALMTVYIIAKGNGIISKWLSTSCMVYLGDRTLYYMLCHQVVLRYMTQIYKRFPWDRLHVCNSGIKVLCILISLGITIASEPVFNKLMKGFRNVRI